MRSLFILLVVMNISYLIWGVAFSEKNEPVVAQEMPSDSHSLTLLSEKPEEVIPRENTTSKKTTALSKAVIKDSKENLDSKELLSRKCFSIGPYFEDKEIEKLEKKLKKGGHDPARKSITDKEPKSYWVYMPATKTMKDAELSAEELKAAKVKDYFIIRKGKRSKSISLGLYNGYNRAKLRKSNLNKLGFNKVLIQTRYKDVTRHWLDFHETASKVVKKADWQKNDKDNVLQKIARPCVEPLPETS